jgi:hypothetical protein
MICGLLGHCIYSYDCEPWQIGCGKCPYTHTYPAIENDQTALKWKLKKWDYNRHLQKLVINI